jgi:hypothetical protein
MGQKRPQLVMLMIPKRRLFSALMLMCLLCLGIVSPPPCRAEAEVKWLQDFPQRAGDQMILMWVPFFGAKSYTISRYDHSTDKTVSWQSAQTYYVDARAEAEKSHSYQISAYDKNGTLLAKSELKLLEQDLPLVVPVWSGSYQDEDKIFLVWEGDSRSLYYNLYKRSPDGTVALIAAVAVQQYVDRGVTPGESYEYFIQAVDRNGQETEGSDLLAVEVEPWAEPDEIGEVEIARRLVEPEKVFFQGTPALREPTDILLFKRNLYVSDLGSRSVVVMGLDGKFVRRYASKPKDYQNEWGIPWGLGIGHRGRKFAVTFLKSPNVRVFDWRGQLLLDILVGLPPEFETNQQHVPYLPVPQPMDVEVGVDGSMWVTDYTYGQVIRYNNRGRETGRSGIPKLMEGSGPFRTPNFLVQHPVSKELHVVDSIIGKIHRLSPGGEILEPWGRAVGQAGALTLPKGITNGPGGELLVVDGMLSTLQAFDSQGRIVAVYRTVDEDRLPLPIGIVSAAVDPDTGDIYLTTKIDSSIYRYIRQD